MIPKDTPGLLTAEGVQLCVGDFTKYKRRDNILMTVRIASDVMRKGGVYGYDAVVHVPGARAHGLIVFCDWKRIVHWDGRVE